MFFIIINHPVGNPMIMMDEDEVAFFSTEDEARTLAQDHDACINFGYEIFELGTGS